MNADPLLLELRALRAELAQLRRAPNVVHRLLTEAMHDTLRLLSGRAEGGNPAGAAAFNDLGASA